MVFLRTLLLWSVGVATGFALALWWLAREPAVELPPAPVSAVQPEAIAADPALQTALVTLQVRSAARATAAPGTTSALLVGAPDLIVAEAAAIAGAERIVVRSASGHYTTVSEVLAFDDTYGLVALRPAEPLADVAVLEASAGAGSLRLGERVVLLHDDGTFAVRVRSAAQRDTLGAYFYEIDDVDHSGLAALLDTGSGGLLGLVTRRTPALSDGDTAAATVALDNDALTRLLADRERHAPLSLAQFNQHYFHATAQGRLMLLQSRLEQGRHAEVIEMGREIMFLDDYSQQHVPPLVRKALNARARALSAMHDHSGVVELVDSTGQWLDGGDELQTLKADALLALQQPAAALQVLLGMQRPALQRARSLVLEHALVGGRNDISVELIEVALRADPQFAPYHRLLGEHLLRTGNNSAAIVSLERAAQLDPSMASELAPVLERLRARQHTPAVAEVPIRRTDGTFMVETRINGLPHRFRFMLDTGASYTAISTATALRLGLDNVFLGAPVVELQTANGRIFTTTANLETVEIGAARVDNVRAVLLESSGSWDGLLGHSFLRHFDIEIDRSGEVIRLFRRSGE